ncbi:MAG: sigma-54 dependent transcriptional regulator, partial [Desulfobacterales bacterium]
KDITGHLKNQNYESILLSFQSSTEDAFRLLKQIKQFSPYTPVIAVSQDEKADLIVEAVKEGVFDFLVKPFLKEKLLLSIDRGLENRLLKNEIDYLRREQDVIYDFEKIVAASDVMKQLMDTLKKYSHTDSTILITGETGTGKSFLSGSVHYNSARRTRPFVKINCANLPENLLESELFGHEKGAFTGADKVRVGRLEQAKGGTVFLDEIGEMTASLQAKLLRVLEEKKFERVGGNKTICSDMRIIAATNQQLENLVAKGTFREDLYYRLNVLRLHIPPLRERTECIEPLADILLKKTCGNLKKKTMGFTDEVIGIFKNYPWPGNIRQMANTIERAVIMEEHPYIRAQNISMPEAAHSETENQENIIEEPKPPETLMDAQKELILQTLEDSLWIQKDAAKKLGVTPRTLNYKIKKLGITHPAWRKHK